MPNPAHIPSPKINGKNTPSKKLTSEKQATCADGQSRYENKTIRSKSIQECYPREQRIFADFDNLGLIRANVGRSGRIWVDLGGFGLIWADLG